MKKCLCVGLLASACSSPTYPTPAPPATVDLRATILSVSGATVRGQVQNLGPDCATGINVSVGGFVRVPFRTRGIFTATYTAIPNLRPNAVAAFEVVAPQEPLEDVTAIAAGTAVRCQ